MFKDSIFLRIYAGLLVLVLLVAAFGYLLVQVINYQRAQEYRESLTDGIAFVMSESIARQATQQQKLDWIADASDLMELPIFYLASNKIELSRIEQNRIDQQQAVVRYDADTSIAYVIVGLKNDPKHYLYIKVDKIGERQMKALPIFILDYLIYYPGQEKQYLAKIQRHFAYPLKITSKDKLGLDSEQQLRLRQEQTVMLYRDNTSIRTTTISFISPMPNNPAEVLLLGPVPIFNWMPFQLSLSITLFSLFLLSLGVYGLIQPLQRKIRQVRDALNKIQGGDLSLRVPVDGRDEMANLSESYNSMSDHIQRLIGAQRELMRAVSHELRTPVARIRFGMEMMAEEDDYDYRLQQMDMIDKDVEALNNLIDEIMTYAKLEQGTPSLDFEQIHLAEMLQQVQHETEALKTDKQLQLQPPAADLTVEAEARYLHRVIQNFVGNAIRYSQHTVRLSAGVTNGMAYVCVEDDGAGVPEVDRTRVFDAFTRLDDSRTRASGGYGLGLSIVNRIAYWFGGSAHVDQSPTLGGARFTMTWPAQRDLKRKQDGR